MCEEEAIIQYYDKVVTELRGVYIYVFIYLYKIDKCLTVRLISNNMNIVLTVKSHGQVVECYLFGDWLSIFT